MKTCMAVADDDSPGDSVSGLKTLVASNFKTLPLKPFSFLHSRAPKIAALAQAEYDEWDEADTDKYAGGGICHYIAEAVQTALYRDGIECITESSNHEQHVFVVAVVQEGVYSVDIPWSVYEKGAGYHWHKLPNVRISPEDVVFFRISPDPGYWKEYVEGD